MRTPVHSSPLQILQSLRDRSETYVTGDLVTLMEWSDALRDLADHHPGGTGARELCLACADLADREITRGEDDFLPRLCRGLNLLTEGMEPGRVNEDDWHRCSVQTGSTGSPGLPPSGGPRGLRAMAQHIRSRTAPVTPLPIAHEEMLVPDVIPVFLAEARERLSRAQECLLAWEADMGNRNWVEELFRIFHTLKGECGFLGLTGPGDLAHEAETLMDAILHDRISAGTGEVEAFLGTCDMLGHFLDAMDGECPAPSPVDCALVTGRLRDLAAGNRPPARAPAESPEAGGVPAQGIAVSGRRGGNLVKVQSRKIDTLVDTIGELLVLMGRLEDADDDNRHIRKITRQLQASAMALRTDSLRTLFGNLRRVVRDTANHTCKTIDFRVSGEELEMDRDLIERIEEPLMHLVRNAVDHGIEAPAERSRKGKPAQGRLVVAAKRKGSHVEILVEDDGRGLDRGLILAKALRRGMVTPDRMDAMSDNEVYALIFAHGFSTSESISRISGRGVGMDIVRQTVQASRGRLTLETEPGRHLRIRLAFPLNAAIVEGVVVRLGSRYHMIPAGSIVESFHRREDAVHRVAGMMEMMTCRGQAVPVLRLRDILGNPAIPGDALADSCGLLVEDMEGRRHVLVADEIITKAELAIKPLGPWLKGIRGVCGVTVLQGGELALLLDVDRIISLGLQGDS